MACMSRTEPLSMNAGTGLWQIPYDPPLLRTLRNRLEDDSIKNKEKSCEEWLPIPHRIILLKEINEKVTQRSLLSIILSAYIYEQQSQSGRKIKKIISHTLPH